MKYGSEANLSAKICSDFSELVENKKVLRKQNVARNTILKFAKFKVVEQFLCSGREKLGREKTAREFSNTLVFTQAVDPEILKATKTR